MSSILAISSCAFKAPSSMAGKDEGLPKTTLNPPKPSDAESRKNIEPAPCHCATPGPCVDGQLRVGQRLTRKTSVISTRLREGMQAETHPELGNAVVDAALVLVDVGPGVAGSTKGGDIAFWGLRNAAEPGEHCSARWEGAYR